MSKKAKGQRPGERNNVTLKWLLENGYTYKMHILTPEEKMEQRHGRKTKDPNTNELIVLQARDFDYVYKEIDGVEIRFYHGGGGQFFSNGGRIRLKSQMPELERRMVETAKWDDVIGKIGDTEIQDTPTEPTERFPDMITLIGGQFDGLLRAYNTKIPQCMMQFKDGHLTKAHIYVRSEEDKLLYEYKREVI